MAAPHIRIENRGTNNNQVLISYQKPINKLEAISGKTIITNPDSTEHISHTLSPYITLPFGLGENLKLFQQWSYPGHVAVYSNQIDIAYRHIVYVPSAFSPNDDKLNDFLEIFGLPTPNFSFTIFDKWGNAVHRSSSNPVWDGNIQSKNAPEGTYTYKLSFETKMMGHKSQVGSFALLRK